MLRTIELSGSPQERGRRHGQILGAEIRQVRRGLLAYLVRVGLYAGALPIYGVMLLLARRFLPHVPAPLKEEMAAVAAGAQLSQSAVLLINVLDDLANNVPRCSGLAVGKGLTEDGAYLLGRNLDYPLFLELMVEQQTLFLMEPHGGLPLASLAWPGYVGVCTGMNRAGVALAQHTAMSRGCSVKGTPAALRFRQALETGTTVSEVAARVLAAPATIGNNLLLGDPRTAVVLELSAGRQAVRHPVDGRLTVTNHYQTRSMIHLNRDFPLRPPFSPLAPYYFTEAYSRSRNDRLKELARGRLEPAGLQAILADPQVANPGTVVSTVFDLAGRTLWVARGSQPPVNQGPFERIKPWG